MKTKLIISLGFVLILLLVFTACETINTNNNAKDFKPVELFPEPAREMGQKDVIELRCDPIDTVHVGFIGLGNRGIGAVERFTYIKGAKITAICDLAPWKIERAQQVVVGAGMPKAIEYTGEDGWKKMCENDDIDLIYIVTNWSSHTPMAVYAMEQGKHAVSELPAAVTIEECWQLVNTSEKTRRHFMQLENCVYDFFELAQHRMAEEGLFGEIVHVEGSYIHDLRAHNFVQDEHKGGYWNMWRLDQNARRNGNLYTTHGFGPLCHILNIHRGDKMDYVVSLSSNQFGITQYAEANFGKNSEFAKREYKRGDMNTSVIRTVNGKTMMIQHDITSPRPYSRMQLVSGTKGYACKYPIIEIVIDDDYHSGDHISASEEELQEILEKYEHPIVKEIGEEAKKVGGHGGMDFIMDYRLIYCLNNGLPLDQDVYDAAEWSALAELSEKSVANYGMSIKFPDFTRGASNKIQKVTYYQLPFLTGLKRINTFINDATVKLISNQKNTEIHYTTDGTEPTLSSTLYTKPFEIKESTSFKVRIFTPDGQNSPVLETHYIKENPLKPVSVKSNNRGLTFEYFEFDKKIKSTNELLKLESIKDGKIGFFAYPYEDGELPSNFGLRFKGYIKVQEEDVYTFSVLSNDGSRLYVADKLVVENDGLHGAQEKEGEIALQKGWHKIELLYFQSGGGKTLKVFVNSNGSNKSEISGSILSH
ncbi:MAG: hypothetical protein GQ525_12985 [Draconibacterium sp.]|nr:hypothetical protein [Draconibacterium sp.]